MNALKRSVLFFTSFIGGGFYVGFAIGSIQGLLILILALIVFNVLLSLWWDNH